MFCLHVPEIISDKYRIITMVKTPNSFDCFGDTNCISDTITLV